MQNNPVSGAEHVPLLWGAMKELQDGFNGHQCSLPYLLGIVHNLQGTLEETRQMYNNAIKQRDDARAKLVAVQNNLVAVERVVSQYASVKDPVVASDGFTYENVSIREYLRECASTNTKAYSQLTKEELLDVVVPNQTLRRLVNMLQALRTTDVPPLSQRRPIPPYTPQQRGGDANWKGSNAVNTCPNNNNGLNWADEEVNTGGTPLRVAELEATLLNNAANPSSLNASQSSNVVTQSNANANNGNNNNTQGRRWEGRQQQQQQQQSAGNSNVKNSTKRHPCLRVYGHCNFLDDCTFAHYPYEACLNYIKGKCRFGQHCKELHVSTTYPRYPGQRNNSTNSQNPNSVATPTPVEEKDAAAAKAKRVTKDKESSKNSSVKGETNSKESVEEQQEETRPTPTLTATSGSDPNTEQPAPLAEEAV